MGETLDVIVKESWIKRASKKAVEPFAELYYVLKDDIGLGNIASDTRKTIGNAAKVGAGVVASIPFYTIGHEALHAISFKMLGKGVDYFGLKECIGGGVFQKIFPRISTNLEEFGLSCFGVVSGIGMTDLENVVMSLVPFALTPFGFSLIRKGKKDKSLFTQGMGLVLALAPLLSIRRAPQSILYPYTALFRSGLASYAVGAGIAASVFVGSKYIADGLWHRNDRP